jgi:hypothetical protein
VINRIIRAPLLFTFLLTFGVNLVIEMEGGEELPGDVAADDHQRPGREVDDVGGL